MSLSLSHFLYSFPTPFLALQVKYIHAGSSIVGRLSHLPWHQCPVWIPVQVLAAPFPVWLLDKVLRKTAGDRPNIWALVAHTGNLEVLSSWLQSDPAPASVAIRKLINRWKVPFLCIFSSSFSLPFKSGNFFKVPAKIADHREYKQSFHCLSFWDILLSVCFISVNC